MGSRLFCLVAMLLWPLAAVAQQIPAPSLPLTGNEIVQCIQNHGYKNCTVANLQVQVNVLTFGADPTGARDSAPAFRAAVASNETLVVPPGTYLFNSTVTPPCCANDPAAVLVQHLNNFHLSGYGATIVIGSSIALSSAFQFDQDTNYSVEGLTIQGTRSGLSSSAENVGIQSSSDVNFTYRNMHFTGNFGGNGTAFAGDWLVNGGYSGIVIDTSGQCFDFAFLRNVSFDTVTATGADTNGNTGSMETGNKCLSVVVDGPNSGTNNTGISFTSTSQISVRNFDVTNYNFGAYISTGVGYNFSQNNWHGNVGLSSSQGAGIAIVYVGTGSFASTGFPPSSVVVSGDIFFNNGNATAGASGFDILQSSITNSDLISNIVITGSSFNDNTTQGISADGTSHLGCVITNANSYLGASQTTTINAFALAALGNCTAGNPGLFTSVTAASITSGSVVAGSPTGGATSGAINTQTGVLLNNVRADTPLYVNTGTAIGAHHEAFGGVTLSGGAGTATLTGSAAYTNSTSYICTANDSTAANAVKVANASGSSVGFTGTGTDVIDYRCIGQ